MQKIQVILFIISLLVLVYTIKQHLKEFSQSEIDRSSFRPTTVNQEQSHSSSIQDSQIFTRGQNLQKLCQKYQAQIYPKSKSKNFNHTRDILNLSRQIPSELIKYDINNQFLFCFPSKTGATNWNLMASSIRRNLTFEQFKYNYEHDFVYHDMLSLDGVRQIYESAIRFKEFFRHPYYLYELKAHPT